VSHTISEVSKPGESVLDGIEPIFSRF